MESGMIVPEGTVCTVLQITITTRFNAAPFKWKLYKTENQWVSRSTIVLNNGSGVNAFSSWVTPYDLNPSNPQELIIGKDEVYKSTDGGFNWNQLGIYPGTAQIDLVYYAPSDPQCDLCE